MPEGRPSRFNWRVLRTALTDLADDDWADDVSDALPSTGLANISFAATSGFSKTTEVEFVVLGYVAATGLAVDNDADTFSMDATLLVTPPAGSSIVGRTTSGEKIALRQVQMTGFRYFTYYRVPCSGADELALRFYSDTGLPGAADRLEVWYREVTE